MKYKIGFIGYGKMAKAIKKYLQICNFGQFYASDPIISAEEEINVIATNCELVEACDIIFLSIKPQNAKEALAGIDFSRKIVISIMAGITIRSISSFCKNAEKVVRVMPNLCASVGKSVNAYACFGLNDNEKNKIIELLSAFGTAYEIDESDFDLITGLTGSGPAFIFKYIKNVIQVGLDHDLSFELSKSIVLDMIEGSTELLRSMTSQNDIQTMINNVCSKGGTTIEGINALNKGDFDNTIQTAIISTIKRSKELGQQ